MVQITIRKVNVEDKFALQKISRETFIETFATSNTKENMDAYLNHNLSIQTLEAELCDRQAAFYFALLNDVIIAYLKINFANAQTELKDHRAMEIERIYVLQNYHGSDIGKQVLHYAIQIAKDHKMDYIWLGVWEHNVRAIRFYEKNGFIAFGSHVFTLGNDDQTDIMMRLELHY